LRVFCFVNPAIISSPYIPIAKGRSFAALARISHETFIFIMKKLIFHQGGPKQHKNFVI
jgi:hypothetical protein